MQSITTSVAKIIASLIKLVQTLATESKFNVEIFC